MQLSLNSFQETSFDIYVSLFKSGKITKQQEVIYNYVRANDCSTAREVEAGLKYEYDINVISARMNDLLHLEVLYKSVMRKCTLTEKQVYTWTTKKSKCVIYTTPNKIKNKILKIFIKLGQKQRQEVLQDIKKLTGDINAR